MKNYLRAFCIVLVLGALAFLPTRALAQLGKRVTVNQRDADVTLLPNGDVQFVETWVVDFQYGSFTFAFREIPRGKLRDIVDVHAYEGDKELELSRSTTDEKFKFTWRFPATNQSPNFVSDTHTFVLKYTVRGALRVYPQGDQFWWKFVEPDRAYTIASARVLLHLPGEFLTDQIKATTYLGANETYGGRVLDAKTIEFNGGPFPPDKFWEIRAQFPHVINAAPEEWQKEADRAAQTVAQNNFYAVLATFLIVVAGPLLLLVLWFLFGRDKPTTFAAEFLPKPPDDTPPGVVGTLLDEHADLQDILATVADLAERGYLRIREADAFGSPVYERTAKSDANLAPFEKETLDALLGRNDIRKLDDVRGSFYYHIRDLQDALYEQVVARGFFPSSPFKTRDTYFTLAKWGALLVPVVGVVTACYWIAFAPLAFLPLLALEILFIALLGLSRVMPQRTAKGATAAAQWNAFRRYLARIEKYTQVQQAKEQFAAYLPYAIAFGLESSWIEKFKQTDAPAPTWYVPYATSSTEWTWRNLGTSGAGADAAPSGSRGAPNSFGAPSTPGANAPLFRDSPADQKAGPDAPNLDSLASSAFVGLNRVSSNMFDFLNSSASAFTEKPQTKSAAESFFGGVGEVVQWVGSSAGSSSSSDSSWSSSSSSSSSDWSGGGSSGGGGGGGGSSGFG
ncbi:MAG: DUF2207 domain-containing protein [Chloroflexi bacterium]|nr:DUF2207 domain-containing protein [Chloroflexota bacterium]